MIQLNLLPDVKKEFLRAREMRRKAISLSIIISLASAGVLVFLGVFLGGQYATMLIRDDEIQSTAQELSEIENIDEYLTIQAQLAQIDGLHGSKANMSRFLQVLPRLNPTDPNSVKFSNVGVAVENTTITFQGGVRNVSALTTFKDTLINAQLSYKQGGEGDAIEEPLFSSVTIDEYGYSSDVDDPSVRVGFVISAIYNPKLFETAAKNTAVTVPNMETTQSVLASPDVTFQRGAGDLEGSNE